MLDDGDEPVVRTRDGRLLVVCHPFRDIDGLISAGLPTAHGMALPVDSFNFDRRPGEVFRRP